MFETRKPDTFMQPKIFWRKVHYWISITTALPLFVILCTGLLLQIKKDVHWIQPREHRGSGPVPALSFEQILAVCAASPEAGIHQWGDVQRLDFRPDKGLLKVVSRGGWEVQIDSATGRMLQTARRRSDWIESLHDGSWFGNVAKQWVFLPSGALLLVLWATGLYLFLLPQLSRRRAVRRPEQGAGGIASDG